MGENPTVIFAVMRMELVLSFKLRAYLSFLWATKFVLSVPALWNYSRKRNSNFAICCFHGRPLRYRKQKSQSQLESPAFLQVSYVWSPGTPLIPLAYPFGLMSMKPNMSASQSIFSQNQKSWWVAFFGAISTGTWNIWVLDSPNEECIASNPLPNQNC